MPTPTAQANHDALPFVDHPRTRNALAAIDEIAPPTAD